MKLILDVEKVNPINIASSIIDFYNIGYTVDDIPTKYIREIGMHLLVYCDSKENKRGIYNGDI